jgi:uncharacterized membrane protein YphA (DoxX/SURF4 family)
MLRDAPWLLLAAQGLMGAVWIFHGLYSKLLNGIPRHRQIVARILGERHARLATAVIGIGEIIMGLWALSGWERVLCASAQTAALVAMNTIEIAMAADLLISAVGMVLLNGTFLTVIWTWALAERTP